MLIVIHLSGSRSESQSVAIRCARGFPASCVLNFCTSTCVSCLTGERSAHSRNFPAECDSGVSLADIAAFSSPGLEIRSPSASVRPSFRRCQGRHRRRRRAEWCAEWAEWCSRCHICDKCVFICACVSIRCASRRTVCRKTTPGT